MIHAPRSVVALALAVLGAPAPAGAQDESPPVVAILVRPGPAPVPALKYRLLPEHGSLVAGNAAVFYHRAIEMSLEARPRAPARERNEAAIANYQTIVGWIGGPLTAIPLDQARRCLHHYRAALHEAELGARRLACDWEFESRTEGVELTLLEIQEMRALGGLVALRVRVAILEGRLDDAVSWLQTGFAMGRHVSQGPMLIQTLVGVSLCANLTRPLEDLIQAPGMPSLYWALVNRPHPFIDPAPALEGERFDLEREIPQLRNLDTVAWSTEQARNFTAELQTKLFRLADISALESPGSGAPGLKDWSRQLGMAALVAQAYPEAKRALIAQGRPAAQVEAMPTIQVAALYTYQTYKQIRDDIFKWLGLPYYQAYKGVEQSWSSHHSELQRRPLLKLFTVLLPAVRSASLAGVRVDRQLDAIACIEAIRAHAAAHGRFPSRLEEITATPVPIDAMTGQPFAYRVDGATAHLSAPYPPGGPAIPQYGIHYELKLTH
jgi:hypothetical protein